MLVDKKISVALLDLTQLQNISTTTTTKSIKYDHDTTGDNLFLFGVELDNDSDKSHSHLGFTGIKLLEQLNQLRNRGIFHLNATYKIVKYCYLLIRFGFKDN